MSLSLVMTRDELFSIILDPIELASMNVFTRAFQYFENFSAKALLNSTFTTIIRYRKDNLIFQGDCSKQPFIDLITKRLLFAAILSKERLYTGSAQPNSR